MKMTVPSLYENNAMDNHVFELEISINNSSCKTLACATKCK